MNAEASNALAAAGRYSEAAELLIRAASDGEADAAFLLAMWRIGGTIVRRNLPAARRLLEQAAQAGHAEARRLHAYFLAVGVGGPVQWERAVDALRALQGEPDIGDQLRLVDAMSLGADGWPADVPDARSLSAGPAAWLAEGFLTPEECAYLARASEPWLQPSVVVDPATGRMVRNPVRRSDGAVFGVTQEDLAVRAINCRIAALSRTRPEQGEPLQILRYRPGDEYRPHLDALPNESNQRIATVIVYLTDDYDGGETEFPEAGLTVRGKRGDALYFRNVLPSGAVDRRTVHAGRPVTRGTKLIATRWIRAREFVFPPPAPATGSRFG